MKLARFGAIWGAILLILAACTAAPAATPSVSEAPSVEPSASEPAESAAPSEAEGPGEPESTTLKIVQGSDPDFTQVMIQKAIEYMEDQGVTVEFSSVVDTDTATRSVIAGQQDIVINSLYFGINANQQDIPLRTFMADITAVDYLMMSIPSVTDVNQLVGGTVGINKPGDLGATIADQCLKSEGIDPADVEFVQVGGTSARMSAVLAEQIQAAPAHAAEALNAQREGALNILIDCGQAIGTFLQTGASAMEEWLAANPNLAQMWTDAYIDACRWAAENKDEYIELSHEVVPELDDELRDQVYDFLLGAEVWGVNGGLTPESIDKLVSIGLDSAAIEEPVPEDWYTMEFIESYLDRHETYEY